MKQDKEEQQCSWTRSNETLLKKSDANDGHTTLLFSSLMMWLKVENSHLWYLDGILLRELIKAGCEMISLLKVDSLLFLLKIREAKKVSQSIFASVVG